MPPPLFADGMTTGDAAFITAVVAVIGSLGSTYVMVRESRRKDRAADATVEGDRTATEKEDDERAVKQYARFIREMKADHKSDMDDLKKELRETKASVTNLVTRDVECRETVARLTERMAHLEKQRGG